MRITETIKAIVARSGAAKCMLLGSLEASSFGESNSKESASTQMDS